jgi:hypothetical protein
VTVVAGNGKQRQAAVKSRAEWSGAYMRRKGNGRGCPLAKPRCGDKASTHVG